MVSKKSFKKFVPSELKLPKAHAEISFTKPDINERKRKKLETVARSGEVVYDTRTKDFYVVYGEEKYKVKIEDKEVIPEYMFNRIKIEVPSSLFPINSQFYKIDYFYFNPFSKSWVTPNFQPVPSAYEGNLYKFMAELFKEEIAEFNKEKGRHIKKANLDKLSRLVVNSLVN